MSNLKPLLVSQSQHMSQNNRCQSRVLPFQVHAVAFFGRLGEVSRSFWPISLGMRASRTLCDPSHPLDGRIGWGGRVRTSEWRNQNPLPYHLATPQQALRSRERRPREMWRNIPASVGPRNRRAGSPVRPGIALAGPRFGGYNAASHGTRSVAQSGSAPRSGRGGRRFESCHSDQCDRPRPQAWRRRLPAHYHSAHIAWLSPKAVYESCLHGK